MDIPTRIITLMAPKGFIEMFYKTLSENREYTHREAFDQLNAEYKSYTGKNRYASFQCFKVIKDRK